MCLFCNRSFFLKSPKMTYHLSLHDGPSQRKGKKAYITYFHHEFGILDDYWIHMSTRINIIYFKNFNLFLASIKVKIFWWSQLGCSFSKPNPLCPTSLRNDQLVFYLYFYLLDLFFYLHKHLSPHVEVYFLLKS